MNKGWHLIFSGIFSKSSVNSASKAISIYLYESTIFIYIIRNEFVHSKTVVENKGLIKVPSMIAAQILQENLYWYT